MNSTALSTYFAYWNEDFGYKFTISAEDFRASPTWLESQAFPPLSPRIAIANSRLAVQSILQEIQPFEPDFSACTLILGGWDERECWDYLVSWRVPFLDGEPGRRSEISIPVLFNGETPNPLKFKYADRFKVYKLPD